LLSEQVLENLQEPSKSVNWAATKVSSTLSVLIAVERWAEHQFRFWEHPIPSAGLTSVSHSVEYGVQPMMRCSRILRSFSRAVAPLVLTFAVSISAQGPDSPSPAPKSKTSKPDPQSRVTIEVSGGAKETPVENASVYFKYVEEHAIKKNKTLELNVKTNRDGVAHVPDAPLGRVLIQVLAEGWKSYGRWFDITDQKQVIKIRLERPPKWY